MDSIYSFAIQLVVGLYKEHSERVAYSANGIRGVFERLYDFEKNQEKRAYFKNYVERFKE